MQLYEIILITADVIIVPAAIWVVASVFNLKEKTMLLDQEVGFLKTNLIKDVQSIKDSLEATQKSTLESTNESKLALKELNNKLDSFLGKELNLLKDMIRTHESK